VNHRITIDEVDRGHDAILQFLFGSNTDMAQGRARELREEALHEVQPRTVLGREGELEAPLRLGREPSPRLFRDVRRMIIEDQVDRRIGGISRVEEPEEFDELAAAVAVFDQGVHLAGQQIDAGQEAYSTVAFVFVITCESWMLAGHRRKIGGSGFDRLNAWFLVLCRTPSYAGRFWDVTRYPTGISLPIGIVCSLQRIEEGEQAIIVGAEAAWLATLVGLELRQGCLLECKMGMQIYLRRID
jgi:hypothetical protein